MGTIDSATITLVCPKCGLRESAHILDKGNGWSGSYWGVPAYSKFEAAVTGGYRHEPGVSGVCPHCNVAAVVSSTYGT